jgi:hypothetical protein
MNSQFCSESRNHQKQIYVVFIRSKSMAGESSMTNSRHNEANVTRTPAGRPRSVPPEALERVLRQLQEVYDEHS